MGGSGKRPSRCCRPGQTPHSARQSIECWSVSNMELQGGSDHLSLPVSSPGQSRQWHCVLFGPLALGPLCMADVKKAALSLSGPGGLPGGRGSEFSPKPAVATTGGRHRAQRKWKRPQRGSGKHPPCLLPCWVFGGCLGWGQLSWVQTRLFPPPWSAGCCHKSLG